MIGKHVAGKASFPLKSNENEYTQVRGKQPVEGNTITSVMSECSKSARDQGGLPDFGSVFKEMSKNFKPIVPDISLPRPVDNSTVVRSNKNLTLTKEPRDKQSTRRPAFEDEDEEYAVIEAEEEEKILRMLDDMSEQEAMVKTTKEERRRDYVNKPNESHRASGPVSSWLEGAGGDEARRYLAANYERRALTLRKTLTLHGYGEIWDGRAVPDFFKELDAASRLAIAARNDLLAQKVLLESRLDKGVTNYRDLPPADEDGEKGKEIVSTYVKTVDGEWVELPGKEGGTYSSLEIELAMIGRSLATNSHELRVQQIMRELYHGLVKLNLPQEVVVKRIVLREFLSTKGISLRGTTGKVGSDKLIGLR